MAEPENIGNPRLSPDLPTRKRRLHFRSWHRGCKETDVILGPFADKFLPEFGEAELSQFEAILEIDDADLWLWLTGQQPLPATHDSPVMQQLLGFKTYERL